jgi:hypothetical protein
MKTNTTAFKINNTIAVISDAAINDLFIQPVLFDTGLNSWQCAGLLGCSYPGVGVK